MSESGSNTRRAMEFIEKLQVWMAEEYHVEIPTPEEYKIARDSAPLKEE